MKSKIYVLCMIALLLSSSLFATIRRVGYTDVPPVAGVDYTSFASAYTAAVSGDTIYVFPGKTLIDSWNTAGCCGNILIQKRLAIFSKGYWLDTTSAPRGNTGMQVAKTTASFGRNVEFGAGSANSIISGFDAGGYAVVVTTSNITVKRNFNVQVYFSDISSQNILVEGNYRVWFGGVQTVDNILSNITIRNNFIYALQLPQKSYTGIIANNTFAFDNTLAVTANGGPLALSQQLVGCCTTSTIELQSGNWIFQDNLIVSYTNASATSNVSYFAINGGGRTVFNNNVALTSSNFTIWPGTGSGNIFVGTANVANIFDGFPAISTHSADDRYVLKAGSPALTANRSGSTVDAGMYGGLTPYKLSMVPEIPSIYSISSPQGNNPTGNMIQINFSTKGNN